MIGDGFDSMASHDDVPAYVVMSSPFDIYFQRSYPSFECDSIIAMRDIQPHEELFDNYITYGGVEYWNENLDEIKAICSGSLGLVSQVENRNVQGSDEL
jgi:hypothetical protein